MANILHCSSCDYFMPNRMWRIAAVLFLNIVLYPNAGSAVMPEVFFPTAIGKEEIIYIKTWNAQFSHTKPTLGMDEAWLTLWSHVNVPVTLLQENGQCFGCPLRWFMNETKTEKIQTKFNNRIAISTAPNTTFCNQDVTLRQHGDYWLIVTGNDTVGFKCRLFLANNPPNIYLPILYLFFILAGLTVIYAVTSNLHKSGRLTKLMRWKRSEEFTPQELTDHSTPPKESQPDPPKPKPKRLVSLDTFRGLSLVVMIFVNYEGGGYYFFEHVPWNGLAVADLVFPWFVFMMGASMAFSFRGMVKRHVPKSHIFLRVAKRTILLFMIGIALNSRWYPFLNRLRIPGVLQRLALTYFLTALPQIFFTKVATDDQGRFAAFRDIIDFWPEWIVQFLYLAVHLGLTFGLPIPGCPKGYLGPGGMHDGGEYFNCTGGAAGYIDRLVLSDNHIYQYPTFKAIYQGSQGFDPEGILGTFSSAFTCFLGLQAGKILLYHKTDTGRLVRWGIWGVITGAIGTILCKASLNDGWIPINKNLWSLSFAMVVAGTGYIFLVLFYGFTDLSQIWSGAPLIYPGMNSLIIYFCHDVFNTLFPIRWRVEDAHWAKLLMGTWSTACWVLIAYILFRKGIFVAL